MPTTVVSRTRIIAVVVYEGFQALDAFGPLDAFDAANRVVPNSYRLQLWSIGGKRLRTESGIQVLADTAIDPRRGADTLILPGGAAARSMVLSSRTQQTLRAVAKRSRRLVSICTGAFIACSLVPSGTRVATHWRYVDELRQRFPTHSVDGDSLYLRDGPLWSSGGITAGIDLALKLIAQDLGDAVAITCARYLVVHCHRAGNQRQFSEPLQMQQRSSADFGELLSWMLNHPQSDLSVSSLADRVKMSPRNFSRKFSQCFGQAPARFVERLRLDHARALLEQGLRIAVIAPAAGFQSPDTFRRSFERLFLVSPSAYRQRYHAADPPRDARHNSEDAR